MLAWIADQIIESRVKAANNGVSRKFLEWSDVKKICLLITRNEFFQEAALERFIKESGKDISTIVFLPTQQTAGQGFISYSKKQLNFLSLPKAGVPAIDASGYDLLIDCNFKEYPSTKLLSGAIKANFKVGPRGLQYHNYFDICIDLKQEKNLENYLKQVMNYLKMIKTKN